MARNSQYKFNPESLQYEKVNKGLKHWALRISLFGLMILGLASLVGWLMYQNIDSPKESLLKEEISFLNDQIVMLEDDINLQAKALQEFRNLHNTVHSNIFGTEPIQDEMWSVGIGGANRYSSLRKYSSGDLLKRTREKADKVKNQVSLLAKKYERFEKLSVEREKKFRHIPAIQPVENEDLTRIASGFGMRIHPVYKRAKHHAGIDFTAPTGTPVYATGDGIIAKADNKSAGYGNRVLIDHGYGYESHYCHLSQLNVKVGQRVQRGDKIGEVGSTGLSTAPHLHYEVIKDREKIDPIDYFFEGLSVEMYEKARKKAQEATISLD